MTAQPNLFESRAGVTVTCACGRSVSLKLHPPCELTFRSESVACKDCGLRLKITGMLPSGPIGLAQ